MQAVSILGTGSFLLPLMTPETSLVQAMVSMILVGLGSFFSLSVIAQNVVPAAWASAQRRVVIWDSRGIAIVGTVVSSSSAGNLLHHLPTTMGDSVATRGMRVPPVRILLVVFIGQHGLKRAEMEVEVKHIRSS